MQPNRAKCAICSDIVESFFSYNEAVCGCGEVHVIGGDMQAFKPSSGNWSNILYVDDVGNRICTDEKNNDHEVEQDSSEKVGEKTVSCIDKQELIDLLETTMKSIQQLPKHVQDSFVTTAHFVDCILLIVNILKK